MILNKIKAPFIKFDIVQFFCSITEKLLENVVSYAQTLTTIPDYIIKLIIRTKKSFFSAEGNIWMEKVESALFDVTIGSHDGAEVCELVVIYLLGKLSSIIYEKNIGLYRGDRLYVIENANGSQLDGLRKGVFAIFHNVGLKITIDTNVITMDLLDVTLDLITGKYYPYRKPNNHPIYVNANFNHPRTILTQLPTMMNTRLSSLSINEEEFNKAKPLYKKALKSSGFNKNLKVESTETTLSQNDKEKWFGSFNPPYNVETKSNTGKVF